MFGNRYYLGQYQPTCGGVNYPYKICPYTQPVVVVRKQRVPMPVGPYFAPMPSCPMGHCKNMLSSNASQIPNVFMAPVINANQFNNTRVRFIFTSPNKRFAVVIPNRYLNYFTTELYRYKKAYPTGNVNYTVNIRSDSINNSVNNMLNIDTVISDIGLNAMLNNLDGGLRSVIQVFQ